MQTNLNANSNSDDVMDYIEVIAGTSSKLEKERLIREGLAACPMFEGALIAAYCPTRVYNVAAATYTEVERVASNTVPLDSSHGTFNNETYDLIEDIAQGKITGNRLIEELSCEHARLNSPSAELLKRILLKDLRAGFSESTINKAKPGTIITFPYMRCSLPPKSGWEKWNWSAGVYSQEKADGMFANVNHYSNHHSFGLTSRIAVYSRQGTSIDPNLLGKNFTSDLCAKLAIDTQTHGELVVFDENGNVCPRQIGNGILNSAANGEAIPDGYRVVFYAWDQIPISEARAGNKYAVSYSVRYSKLLSQIGLESANNTCVHLIPTRVVYSQAQAFAHYKELLQQGKEGTICKSPEAIWKDGTSKEQVKLKLEVVVDLEIIGYNEGTGKYQGMLGSFQCASKCGKLRVDVNGRGDAQRAEVWANRAERLGDIISVKANGVLLPGDSGSEFHSLFLPVFVEDRFDKFEADTLEQIQDQFKAAVNP